MTALATICASVVLCTSACERFESIRDGQPSDQANTQSQSSAPDNLVPCMTRVAFEQAAATVGAVDKSFADVLDRGRAYIEFMGDLRSRLITRNPRLFGFTPDRLGAALAIGRPQRAVAGFVRQPDGRWHGTDADAPDLFVDVNLSGTFPLEVSADPFDIRNYLEDITVIADSPPDEMLLDAAKTVHFEIHHGGPGPLAPLMTFGEHPPNPIDITLSLADLLRPLDSAAGTWDGLALRDYVTGDTTVENSLTVDGVAIHYRAVFDTSRRRDILERHEVPIDIHLSAASPSTAMNVTTSHLKVGARGFVFGNVYYTPDPPEARYAIDRFISRTGELSWRCEGFDKWWRDTGEHLPHATIPWFDD